MNSELEELDSETFAETALRLGGKSEGEARRTGAIDRADDQVEDLFAPRYQTVNSPIHRLVWAGDASRELFRPDPMKPSEACARAMNESLEVARRRKQSGELLDENAKISEATLDELGAAGYWGMLIDPAYGGQGAPMGAFAPFLTRMATIDPTVSGLASVHGCIGAVDPVRTFGTPEQKDRFLPGLASGERLSAFALTEPGAGSDLTALRTRAELDGNEFVVNGEKLFITNAVPGRTIGLVCLIEDRPAVLIVDLPEAETEHFRLKRYGLYALKHAHNNGLIFRDFRVPKENLLEPARGDGLTVAYHGLNLGRVALCAGAAGNMRVMLANLLPWARFRKTYGEALLKRELVRGRIARLAGSIVACDALTAWCAGLLDRGYRGEMECTIAKVFGSEVQKDAAIELFMKTHGGRSFLHGHLFGDNVHEFLAPCIYEGEGDMLCMGFFKSLVKQHGKAFFEPIGKALQRAGLRTLNPANPSHVWLLRKELASYTKWYLATRLRGRPRFDLSGLPADLAEHARFALDSLNRSPLEVGAVLRKHQLKLADRQCRMAVQSQRIQSLVTILVTSLHAGRGDDELVRAAGDLQCRDLRRQLAHRGASDADYRQAGELGAAIAEGGFKAITGISTDEILMGYAETP